MEIDNLPEKEFRIMIVKMTQDLGKRVDAESNMEPVEMVQLRRELRPGKGSENGRK